MVNLEFSFWNFITGNNKFYSPFSGHSRSAGARMSSQLEFAAQKTNAMMMMMVVVKNATL